MLVKRFYGLKLLLVGIMLFSLSFYFSNEAHARSLGYKWYYTTNTITFKTGFNSIWRSALTNAMGAWNAVNDYVPMALSTETADTDDSKIVSINDTSINWIARMYPTTTVLYSKTYIRKAEIRFNLKYSFYVGKQAGFYDIQSVATHEFGHAIGIAHCHDYDHEHAAVDSEYTMYNYSFTNSIIARSLHQYDKDAKNEIY